MNGVRFRILIIGFIQVLLLAQCGLFFNSSSVVEINLGTGPVPPGGGDSFKPTVITGGSLRVDLPDGEPLVKDFGKDDDTIRMVVPSGRHRTIELEIALDPDIIANPGPVLSYIGTAVVDLAPNETKRVSLKMVPGRTRLLVPDMKGSIVAQMNTITDSYTTYKTLTQDVLNAVSSGDWPLAINGVLFNPIDVDLDARGAIYIANYQIVNALYNRIVRMRTIDGAGFTQFPATGGFAGPVVSLAVDKTNNFLYFYAREAKNPGDLSRINLKVADSGAPYTVEQIRLYTESLYSTDVVTIVYGMDTDKDGYLYIACLSRDGSRIVKIDFDAPQGSRIVGSYTDAAVLSVPFDVLVKGDYVYVSNYGGTDPNKVLLLRKSDLSFVRAGAIVGQNGEGSISLPTRFFSVTSKKIYLIDDNAAVTNALVEFYDLNWNGWGKANPLNAQGASYFQFFN